MAGRNKKKTPTFRPVTQDVMEPYKYRPLSGPRQIRVMILQPAIRYSAPIRCTLKHQNLDAKPFEALSYVWGSTEDRQVLYCEDKTLKITKNLDNALRDIRKRHRKMRLWVDAVCINQDDIDEKSIQIKLMTEIYSKAKHCVIWLNPDETQSEWAFVAMKTIYAVFRPSGHDRLYRWHTKAKFYRFLLRYVFVTHERAVELLEHLCTREWFYRLWTFQELLLNRSPRVVYGRYCISWDALCMADKCLSWTDERNWRFTGRESFRKSIASIEGEHNSQVLDGDVNVKELLLEMKRLQASDPADKVIGALAIFEQVLGCSLPLEYRSTVPDLYSIVSRAILAQFKDLKFLLDAATEQQTPSLPSWCIDWNSWPGDDTHMSYALSRYRLSFARRGEKQTYVHPEVNSEVSQLRLEGFLVGAIGLCAGPRTGKEDTRDDAWGRWLAFLRGQASTIDAVSHQAACALVIYGREVDSLTQAMAELLEADIDRGSILQLMEKHTRTPDELYGHVENHSLFIMDNGHMGRCYTYVEIDEGDMIFQPAVDTFLVVLRPVHGREGFYRYLGPAKVHGLKQFKKNWEADEDKPDYCCEHRIELGEQVAITLV